MSPTRLRCADGAMAVTASLDRVLSWAADQRFEGHSKFDLFNSARARRWIPRHTLLRAVAAAVWGRSPIDLRRVLQVETSRNPKGIALFARAYLRRFAALGESEDAEIGSQLLGWLRSNAATNFSGACWGYDHDWYGLHFAAPAGHPNAVVTGNIALAFLEAYQRLDDIEYLEMARSSVDFFLEDLPSPISTPTLRSIGYVPGNNWSVVNVSGLVASVLLRVATHTGEEKLRSEARRLMRFVLGEQTDLGAWHYAAPATTSNVRHDNYHTGNVLDWVLDYWKHSADPAAQQAYLRGLDFYRQHLFLSNGWPKWRSNRRSPADAHSAGQALVSFSAASLHFGSEYLEFAFKIAQWAIDNLQHHQGWFRYQKSRIWTKNYTLMRWCNGWMSFGLASLMLARVEAERRSTPCAVSLE